jgi:Bifunctional DNA primase/polymerase, N-terminal
VDAVSENAEVAWFYAASRRLADMAFHLLPVEYAGKRALLDDWPHNASNDPAQLREWFASVPRNIGLACGMSGLLVVDEDVRGAFAGYAHSIGETIPKTFTVLTGKGSHFYFRATGDGHGNARGALRGRGIDVRGVGGYVVGPDSMHPSRALYEALDWDMPVADTPAWLQEALRPRQAVSSVTAPDAIGGSEEGCVGPLYRLLTAVEGERNEILFWAANRALDAGHDPHKVMEVFANAALMIGLGESEARGTITSAIQTSGMVRE